MHDRKLTKAEQSRAHWISLFLRLPEEKIEHLYSSEAACRHRLKQVRWPHGPVCPKCSNDDIGFLEVRKLFRCLSCKAQFSLTSGTMLHGKKVSLQTQFALSADIIRKHAVLPGDFFYASHDLKNRYGVAYMTAIRLKNILVDELRKEHGGLLGRCICARELQIPQDIDVESVSYLHWLKAQMQRRLRRASGVE